MQQKKDKYLEINMKTQNYLNSCTECKSRIIELIRKNQVYFDHCSNQSSAICIVNIKNNAAPVLNYNNLLLDPFKDLNVGQL